VAPENTSFKKGSFIIVSVVVEMVLFAKAAVVPKAV